MYTAISLLDINQSFSTLFWLLPPGSLFRHFAPYHAHPSMNTMSFFPAPTLLLPYLTAILFSNLCPMMKAGKDEYQTVIASWSDLGQKYSSIVAYLLLPPPC